MNVQHRFLVSESQIPENTLQDVLTTLADFCNEFNKFTHQPSQFENSNDIFSTENNYIQSLVDDVCCDISCISNEMHMIIDHDFRIEGNTVIFKYSYLLKPQLQEVQQTE